MREFYFGPIENIKGYGFKANILYTGPPTFTAFVLQLNTERKTVLIPSKAIACIYFQYTDEQETKETYVALVCEFNEKYKRTRLDKHLQKAVDFFLDYRKRQAPSLTPN